MTIENHQDLVFAEIEYGRQADFMVTAVPGDELRVSGICPRCGGLTNTTVASGSPEGAKGVMPQAPAPGKERTIICHCGHTHRDKPSEYAENGCGAYWLVELP